MDRRYVRLDPRKLDYLRLHKGWSLEELYEQAALKPHYLDKRTVKSVVNGESTFVKTGKAVADVLAAPSLIAVLHPDLLPEIGPPSGWATPTDFFTTIGEWEAIEAVCQAISTSNGLRYDVWKLRHRHVAGRFGRGKCYDMHRMPADQRTRHRTHLTRHSQVCDQVGHQPHITRNFSAQAWDQADWWWVIDEWIDGPTLADIFAAKEASPTKLRTLMTQTASAIQALHHARIIRRELSPQTIVCRQSDGAAVLTDFELAKLTEGAPTVRPENGRWRNDAYRAPEVDAGEDVDARADIYSWGRILIEGLCGVLPPQGTEEQAVQALPDLPKSVRTLALACVSPARSLRPRTMIEVESVFKRWNV